jgi:hypothetical protein
MTRKVKVNRLMKSALFLLPGLLLIFALNSCKDFGTPDWELSVSVEEGVEGTPSTGVYQHKELTTIDYNYYPLNEDNTLEVLVNDSRESASGQLIMYTNITLVVRVFDIRDTWNIALQEDDSDDEPITFDITFSGSNFLSGTFTDTQGHSGTWSITSTTLTITYDDWENYELIGTIPLMSGTWSNGDDITGTWSAVR